MWHFHIDTPHLLIAFNDHPDLLRRLNEADRIGTALSHEHRHARRHAARSRRKGDFSRQHLVDVFFHALLYFGFQIGIGQIRNPEARLISGTVWDKRMGGIADHGRGHVAGSWLKKWPGAIESDP